MLDLSPGLKHMRGPRQRTQRSWGGEKGGGVTQWLRAADGSGCCVLCLKLVSAYVSRFEEVIRIG